MDRRTIATETQRHRVTQTVSVDIASQKILEDVYTELKQVPGLKFAL